MSGTEVVAGRQLADLAGRCQVVDGIAPLGASVLAATTVRALAVHDGPRLVAVAVLPDEAPAELCVDPAYRRRGFGSALLNQLPRSHRRVWAHGDLAAARALAAVHHFQPTRVLLQLRRLLPVSPERDRQLPPGIVLTTFRPGQDETVFLAANARAFAWHPEQGRLDAAGLAADLARPWADPTGFLMAWRGGTDTTGSPELVGFHWTKIHPSDPTPGPDAPDGDVSIGEVYVIAVDPKPPSGQRPRGLAVPLTVAGLDLLAQRGQRKVMLYVEADNDAAVRLYQRLGFTEHLRDVLYQVPSG